MCICVLKIIDLPLENIILSKELCSFIGCSFGTSKEVGKN